MVSIRAVAAGLLLSMLAAVPAAQAGGFYVKEQSVQGLGRAFAGMSAYAGDASAVYFNPAMLTRFDKVTATVGVYGLLLDTEQENLGTTRTVPGLAEPIPVLGRNGGNPFDGLVPLGNVYIAGPADKDGLIVGVGVNSPFGLNDKYHDNFFGRYDSIKSLLFNINVQPTVAYKIASKVSVGVGLDIQYTKVTLTNALPNVDPALGDGIFKAQGNDWNLGFNVGIYADLDNLQMGAHYRSGVDYILKGDVQIRGLAGPLEPLNGISAASAPLHLPAIVSGGLAYTVPDTGFRVLFDLTWFKWSDFEAIRVETAQAVFETMQNYKNTWSFALGGEYDASEQLTIRAGMQFDQTPTRDGFRDTRVPDGDRWWAAAGLSYRLSDRFNFDFSYAHVFVESEGIDLFDSFFAGTPAQVDVRTLARTNSVGNVVAVGATAKF